MTPKEEIQEKMKKSLIAASKLIHNQSPSIDKTKKEKILQPLDMIEVALKNNIKDEIILRVIRTLEKEMTVNSLLVKVIIYYE
jgi:hypothetical protein